MPRLYVVRHGETDANREHRLLGRLDPPLNANGERHAAHVASWLQPRQVARIYASPLRRAKRTAAVIADACGATVMVDERLMEVDFGRLDGMRIADAERLPEYQARFADRMEYRPPEGETYRELLTRIETFFKETMLEPDPAATAIVAHQGTIRMIAALLGVMPQAEAAHMSFGHQSVLSASMEYGRAVTARIEDLSC